MVTLTEAQREFLANPFVGAVTTVGGGGALQTTVVWVDADDESVLFCTLRGRAKERHLAADPRVSLLVLDPANAYRWLAVGGRATIDEDGADAQVDRMARKYLGQEELPWRSPGDRWVIARIRAERIETTGI